MARAKLLGVSSDALIRAARRNPCLLTAPIEKLLATRDALACGLDLSAHKATQLWLRSPHLLTRRPHPVLKRFTRLCKALGLAPDELKRIILDTAGLLETDPAATLARLRAAAAVFQLPVDQYVRLGLKQSSLLNFTAETLRDRVADFDRLLGFTPAMTLRLAARYPEMMVLDPLKAKHTLDTIAQELDLPSPIVRAAAIRHPSLLSADPKPLRDRLGANAQLLGVSISDLLAAALKCPPLLSLTSVNLAMKAPLIFALQQASGVATSMEDALRISPAALTYSAARLDQRIALAKLYPGRFSFSVLLCMAAPKVARLLSEHPSSPTASAVALQQGGISG